MIFVVLNTYTGNHLSSGRDMATTSNLCKFDSLADAEWAVLELTLTYPGTEGHWSIQRVA